MRTMYCCGQERRWGHWWFLLAFLIPIGIAAGIFVFGWVVMLLWNALLPAILGVGTITFWQALGILILSKILFGSFGGGHHRSFRSRSHRMHEKWMHLSPEEQERIKTDWERRCSRTEEAKE